LIDRSGGLGCLEDENQVPTGCRYCEFGEFAMIPCHNALFRENQVQLFGDLTQKWQQVGKDATSLDWSPYDTFDTNKYKDNTPIDRLHNSTLLGCNVLPMPKLARRLPLTLSAWTT